MENIDMNEEKIKIPKTSFQLLGILVLDGSGTMKEQGETGQTKANEVHSAVRSLIGRLKVSSNKNNFYLSIITYDEDVIIRKEPTQVLDMNENDDYNPLNGHGGLTAIGDALEKASEIAERFLNEKTEYPRSVVIVLITGVKNTIGKDPAEVIEVLKKSGKIGMGKIESIRVAGYGKDRETDDFTLQQLDTNGSYQRCYTVDSLRDFLFQIFSNYDFWMWYATQVVPILVPRSEEINILIVSCRSNQPHISQINRAPITIPPI